MSVVQSDRLRRKIIIVSFLLLPWLIAVPHAISQPCAVSPSVGGVTVLPNALMIVDNSGSMLYAAYPNAYSNSTTYYGLFDPTKRYNYNSTNKYFEENASGSWSGNFLNWAAITRWDVAIYVLTGQRYVTVGSDRFLVSNPDNRYYDSSFIDNHWYNDTDDVTPYTSGTSRRYKAVPFYNADDYDFTITDKRWSYLEVYTSGSRAFFYLRLKVSSSYEPQGLVHTLQNRVRFGLMHFNDSEGGYIRRYVNKLDSTQLSNVIADLHRPLVDETSSFTNYISTTWTPLAETLYEATRYFRQVSPTFASSDYVLATSGTPDPTRDPLYNTDYADKIWCTKNYVVIVTDGEATHDRQIPENDDDSPARPLRDADGDGCDGDACPANQAGCGYEAFSCSAYPFDCVDPSSDNCGSAYLDDVAFYAHNNDLRNDLSNDQSITTHTVFVFGASDAPGAVLLEKTANNGGGEYHLATDAPALADALEDIFLVITEKAAAAASTAITSEPVSGIDMIYVPYYKNPQEDQWLGNIRAFRLDASSGYLLAGSTGNTYATDTDGDLVLDNPKWEATAKIKEKADADSRTIFTYISGSKVDFDTSHAATIGPYFDVDLNANSTEDETSEVDALISYIRGNDNPTGFTTLRERDPYYLGDIMHASPVFVGKPSARYDLMYGDISYWQFYWTYINRAPVLYAPANDGMLHCFDADDGEELWAYIPHNLLPHLQWFADPDYCHCYYVDLTANVWDLKLSSGWKSVLVGGMRLGGTPNGVDTDDSGTDDETLKSAMFALDVTDPSNPEVLWEINDNTNARFGYTTSKPIPVRVEDGGTTKWFLVFGSGPKTRDGAGADTSDGYSVTNGYIFVLDLGTGGITQIDVGPAWRSGNFFGSPVAIDYDLDYKVDLIYIGDAKGNLWRIKTFTVSGEGVKTYQIDPAAWSIDVNGDDEANPEPLLSLSPVATDQPILIKPTVAKDAKGRIWVFFGTGRYFCAEDNEYCGGGNECATSGDCYVTDSGQTRSKFMTVGVYDRHWYNDTVNPENSGFVFQSSTLGMGDLDHRIIMQGTVVGNGATGYYIVDAVTGEIDTDVSTNGWYYHLLDDRERCLGDFTLYQEALLYLTFTPDVSDPCVRGGLSNVYGVNYISGTSLTTSIIDITAEGVVDVGDLVEGADSKRRGAVVLRLPKGFAGGGLKIKRFAVPGGGYSDKAYPPLPDNPPITIEPPGPDTTTGITSWREVLQ